MRRIFEFLKMSICEKKSQFLNIIGRCAANTTNVKETKIVINDKEIDKVKSIRYLGLWY